ncbi:MAG: CheW domain-containing protein [Chloroflexi bacterium]|nr:CheW domain-containing protein [Chloroflexota bacterium]
MEQNDASEDWRYVVTFDLDQQTYAVPIESVVKISEITALTPASGADSSIAGMIEIAGRQIPAVNLRRQNGSAENRIDPHTPVLTVQIGEVVVAMIVDKIAGVWRLPATQVERSAKMLPGTMMNTPRGNALLLSLASLFTADQINVLAQCAPALPGEERPN